jgi:hypothetical protein
VEFEFIKTNNKHVKVGGSFQLTGSNTHQPVTVATSTTVVANEGRPLWPPIQQVLVSPAAADAVRRLGREEVGGKVQVQLKGTTPTAVERQRRFKLVKGGGHSPLQAGQRQRISLAAATTSQLLRVGKKAQVDHAEQKKAYLL